MDEKRLAELRARVAAKHREVEQALVEIQALEDEIRLLLVPPRPALPAPAASSPLPTIQLSFSTPVARACHWAWEDTLSAVEAKVEAMTKGQRFWVGIASNNTYRQRMRDGKYSRFGTFCLVFKTLLDEERRRMETHLVARFPTRTYNVVNGGGGSPAGEKPLFVYIVY